MFFFFFSNYEILIYKHYLFESLIQYVFHQFPSIHTLKISLSITYFGLSFCMCFISFSIHTLKISLSYPQNPLETIKYEKLIFGVCE